ncbi:MAG TPA: glycoside hydrolase family 76 protein [Polyangiaceae bacterium]|nr:glycoside hydrolase family 76 protein [Polyangiaceae bacterium]
MAAPVITGGSGGTASAGVAGVAGAALPPERPLRTPTAVTRVVPGEDWHTINDLALGTLEAMYDPAVGQWTSGPRWSWASGVEAALASFARSNGMLARPLFEDTFDLNSAGNFLDDLGYDDQGWWGNAWVRAFDLTGDARYLDMAEIVFADMTTAWNEDTCGGGIWWNRNFDYKNAITLQLFFLLAAQLHNRMPGDTSHLAWAETAWTWFGDVGMTNEQFLVEDGLTNSCQPNGGTPWTYNQGVLLGALTEMYWATSDASYLDVAEQYADASTSLLASEGVLQEPCEPDGDCDDNQTNFKGIYQRYLGRLQVESGRYGDFLLENARAVWHQAQGPDHDFGLSWSGPFDKRDFTRQASAIHALSAVVAPYTAEARFVRAAGGGSFNHAMGHVSGALAWGCDSNSCPEPGLMQAGPFLTSLPVGAHAAHFTLELDYLSPGAAPFVTLEVFDTDAGSALASRALGSADFSAVGERHDFALPFAIEAGTGAVEFRVYWHDTEGAPELVVRDVAVSDAVSVSGANLGHECGRLGVDEHWQVDRHAELVSCVAASGGGLAPGAGPFRATFELAVDNFAWDAAGVATLEVVDRATAQTVASRTVTRADFTSTLLHSFSLDFAAENAKRYDFRVTWLYSPRAPRLDLRAIYLRPG